jgi:NAD(P)-dependent dehydrogenase (short-subunit alcohol dehydrogenase family)
MNVQSPPPLEGKRAVVTGGGRGIGAAVARALAAEGAAVLVAARSLAEVEAVAGELREIGCEAWAATCDVTDPLAVAALVRTAEERLGGVDILVNNAGIANSAPLRSLTLEVWNRTFAVNATGTFLCTQAFVPGMVERGWGRVVNVASIAARAGAAYIAAYAASKHAVLGFTRSVAAELATTGVTVNAVCPGYVDTAMTTDSVDRIVAKTSLTAEQARQAILKTSPQNRLLEPEEVAFQVVNLCDPRAKGITGQAIVLDGGGLLS